MFFKNVLMRSFCMFWKTKIARYHNIHGLNVTRQAMDCAPRKNPIDQDKQRYVLLIEKAKTKLRVLSSENGIVYYRNICRSNTRSWDTIMSQNTAITSIVHHTAVIYRNAFRCSIWFGIYKLRSYLENSFQSKKQKRENNLRPTYVAGLLNQFILG